MLNKFDQVKRRLKINLRQENRRLSQKITKKRQDYRLRLYEDIGHRRDLI